MVLWEGKLSTHINETPRRNFMGEKITSEDKDAKMEVFKNHKPYRNIWRFSDAYNTVSTNHTLCQANISIHQHTVSPGSGVMHSRAVNRCSLSLFMAISFGIDPPLRLIHFSP